jgi:hypothetical protein
MAIMKQNCHDGHGDFSVKNCEPDQTRQLYSGGGCGSEGNCGGIFVAAEVFG